MKLNTTTIEVPHNGNATTGDLDPAAGISMGGAGERDYGSLPLVVLAHCL